MSEYKEQTDPTPTDVELLTQNVAALTLAVQSQNVAIMCLLNKLDPNTDLDFSHLTKEQFEKKMNEKIVACEKAIREVYGRSETNKS